MPEFEIEVSAGTQDRSGVVVRALIPQNVPCASASPPDGIT